MTEKANLTIRASSFELETDQKLPDSDKRCVGSVGIDDSDKEVLDKLKELCSRGDVEKVIILYHNYQFSLVGVSLAQNTDIRNSPHIRINRESQFRFQAKDIGLANLQESQILDT